MATEEVIGMRFLLRSLGVPVDGPIILHSDNIGMLQSSIFPDSTLKKKNSFISYHFLKQSVAVGTIVLRYVKTNQNRANMLTKALGPKHTKEANSMVFSR